MKSLRLDPNFKPMVLELNKFKEEVKKANSKTKLTIALKRQDNLVYQYSIDIFNNPSKDDYNLAIIERIVKTLLWSVGGYEIYIYGSKKIYEQLKEIYSLNGARKFDYDFMSTVFEKEFKVIYIDDINNLPKVKESALSLGGHLDGKRLGFDAGGSDMKISSIINGEVTNSEEIVWLPKLNDDISYHEEEAYKAFKKGIEKLGGDVDAIGISSAGVIIRNRPMICSLFIKVKKEQRERVINFYINIVKRLEKELGHPIPFEVANDGDISALAGALDIKEGSLLGLAMGTSEATGYVNKDQLVLGWLNELAFAPVDFNNSITDEWSGDYGVGCKYLSQDAVIKLAERANIKLDSNLTLAQKLKFVQELCEKDDKTAIEIFETVGIYLAYALAYYEEFYDIKHCLLLGRVVSKKGGDIIMKIAQETLDKEFPQYKIHLFMPSEYIRRVGQSIAAGSLAKSNN